MIYVHTSLDLDVDISAYTLKQSSTVYYQDKTSGEWVELTKQMCIRDRLEASTYSLPVGGFPQVAGINYTISTAVAYDANAETYPASTYYGPVSYTHLQFSRLPMPTVSMWESMAMILSPVPIQPMTLPSASISTLS